MFDLQHTLDLMEEGAFGEAASVLKQVVAQMPAYTPAYVLLAQAYEAQARWPKALEAWQHAHFFAPNSPVVEAGLLRVLDRYDALAEHDDAPAPGEAETADPMDRLADELIETIREQEAKAPAEDIRLEESISEDEASPAPGGNEPRPEDASDEDVPDTPPGEESPSSGTASNASKPTLSPLDELAQRLPAPNQPLPSDIEDLDRLIDELESARINPQPDLDEAPSPDLDNDIEDMVSETLARIYISQKQYAEAARVYMRLAEQDPDRADEYFDKAADLRARAQDEESR